MTFQIFKVHVRHIFFLYSNLISQFCVIFNHCSVSTRFNTFDPVWCSIESVGISCSLSAFILVTLPPLMQLEPSRRLHVVACGERVRRERRKRKSKRIKRRCNNCFSNLIAIYEFALQLRNGTSRRYFYAINIQRIN